MVKNKKEDEELTLNELPGVGPATADKLIQVGFTDVMSIAVASPGQLIDATGMNDVTAKKIIHAARTAVKMGFESGIEVMKKREKVIKMTTGCEAFDKLLGGGFESGSITECYGEFGSGKTQIGHLLAVRCQIEDPEAIVVYIDSENTFRPERITQFAIGAGLDPTKVLANIKVAKAFNSDHQSLLAEKVEELIKDEKLKVRLLIIDSLVAHFRAEFSGRSTLADRQQRLNRHMHVIMKLADLYNVCVYVTNQVMADPAQMFGDPTKSVGGFIVSHNSCTRIYLRKGKKGSRVAKLVDSPQLADGECNFMVEEGGIRDV